VVSSGNVPARPLLRRTVLGIETRLDDGAQEVRMYRLYRE